MPVNYIDLKEAKQQSGLRMTVVGGLPSPWSEAAKSILHIKKIPYSAIRLDPRDNDMANWSGSRSAPVLMFENESPRTGWVEILLLAERLSSEPSLLPKNPKERALALELCHEICGEMGLGWVRRLECVDSGLSANGLSDKNLSAKGGFPEPIAKYLGAKYGYQKQQGPVYKQRVISLLNMLTEHLQAQREAGHRFYFGSTLSALDIYSATFMALFKPLPQAQCPMFETIRPAFESCNDDIAAALDGILIEHRDFIYSEFLELPLSL